MHQFGGPDAILARVDACLTAGQAERQFQGVVEANRDCTVAADCVVVYPGCPLGCGVAVGVVTEADVRSEAERLIERYELSNPSCSYRCAAVEPTCNNGVCQAVDVP